MKKGFMYIATPICGVAVFILTLIVFPYFLKFLSFFNSAAPHDYRVNPDGALSFFVTTLFASGFSQVIVYKFAPKKKIYSIIIGIIDLLLVIVGISVGSTINTNQICSLIGTTIGCAVGYYLISSDDNTNETNNV